MVDLTVHPAGGAELVARLGLLLLCAFACHGLGVGLRLFVTAAPVSAAILIGALFACILAQLADRR